MLKLNVLHEILEKSNVEIWNTHQSQISSINCWKKNQCQVPLTRSSVSKSTEMLIEKSIFVVNNDKILDMKIWAIWKVLLITEKTVNHHNQEQFYLTHKKDWNSFYCLLYLMKNDFRGAKFIKKLKYLRNQDIAFFLVFSTLLGSQRKEEILSITFIKSWNRRKAHWIIEFITIYEKNFAENMRK